MDPQGSTLGKNPIGTIYPLFEGTRKVLDLLVVILLMI